MRQSTPVSTISRYGVAIALTLAALFLRWRLTPILGLSTLFIFLAITISAWYGGLGTGLTSTFLICGFAVAFPSLVVSSSTGNYSALPFIFTIFMSGSVVSVLVETLRRAQSKAEMNAAGLAHSNEQFALLVNSVPDYGIFMLDAEGRIQGWNEGARQIKGYEADEIIGQHFSVFYPAEDIACGKPEMELKEARETGKFKEESWRLRKNGARFWANIVITAVRDANGDLRGFSNVTRDMTERREAEERDRLLIREQAAREEAENANKAKDQFLAILSHELRTPLNTIIGWSYLLKNDLLDEQAARDACESIERSSQIQMRLIEDLLDVSRMLAGKLSVEKVPLDLTELVSLATESISAWAAQKEIELQVLRYPTPLLVSGDTVRLQQVILNLLQNSIKFTPSGGKVMIELSKKDSFAEIRIHDTGSGISSVALPHIFEHFHQADSSPSRKYGGLGLGLSIVRHVIEAHDGSIQAQSPGEGLGTTFTICLPLLSTPAAALTGETKVD